MASGPQTLPLRPHHDLEGDIHMIQEWARKNGSTMNSILNSFIPAIAYVIQNQVFESDGLRYIRADFGDILLREPNSTRHHNRDHVVL